MGWEFVVGDARLICIGFEGVGWVFLLLCTAVYPFNWGEWVGLED